MLAQVKTPRRAVSLIGAPTDIGAGHRGASMGPEALRVAGLPKALADRGLDVIDRGNLSGPVNPWQPPQDGYRHLAQVVAWNRSVFEAVDRELADDRLPILLGGDHCLALGSIAAISEHCRERGKTLRVLWLDAHADFNTATITPSGNIHGMPVACLFGRGPKELVEIAGRHPLLDASQIKQIGIRSVDPGPISTGPLIVTFVRITSVAWPVIESGPSSTGPSIHESARITGRRRKSGR